MYQKKSIDTLMKQLSDPVRANGYRIASFLNMSTGAGRARILHIAELLKVAGKSQADGLPASENFVVDGVTVTATTDSDWPGFQSMMEAENALSRYRSRLRLFGPTVDVPTMRSNLHHDTSEEEAAHKLVSVWEAGKIAFLRECPVCKRWFYASRKDSQTCGEKCGRKTYASTPFYQARARLQARITYWGNHPGISARAKAKAKEKIKVAQAEMEQLKEDRP